MDLLNNIWINLSEPNIFLMNLLLSFSTIFLEVPLSFYLIKNIFKLKPTLKQKLAYIFTISLISLLVFFVVPTPYNIVINYVVVYLTLYIIFKMSVLKTLLATILPSIVFAVIGNLILPIYLNVLHISTTELNTIPLYRISVLLILYAIIFSLVFLFKHRNFKLQFLENFDNKSKFIIISNFMLGLLNIIVQFFIIYNYIDVLPFIFNFLILIPLIAYFFISIFSLDKAIKLFTTKEKLIDTAEKLESVEAYNETLRILHDNVSAFKHDFGNIVSIIGGYIKTNDMTGLKAYYSELEDDCNHINNLYVLNPDLINSPGIYNLLVKKYKLANEQNIKTNLTFLLDLNELNMKIYEFSRIFGILLDNAIEAASESKEKIVNIIFRRDYGNNKDIVQIENSYLDKNVDINKIFQKGVSQKENHSGIGLWEVRQILYKNINANLVTKKDSKYFTQILEINCAIDLKNQRENLLATT